MSGNDLAQSAGFNIIRFISWILYVIFGFVIIVLAFAFALLLFGADPDAGFANFIYESAARFVDPFRGMITPTELGNGGLISWSSLFAMAAYLVLIWLVGIVGSWARRGSYRAQKAAASGSAVPSAPENTNPDSPAPPPVE